MRRLTTEEFIKRAEALHHGFYDYSESFYVDAHTPVTIICHKHGKFLQEPGNHMRGYGCPICNKVEKRRLSIDEFIDKAQAVHGDTYDYSEVEYVNTGTPVKIICRTHGRFEQTPNKHLSGQGCPKCAPNYKDTTESFIKKARKVHGDAYDYSRVVYKDEHTKVCIIDPVYGEFMQTPNSHLNGRGHPARKAEKSLATRQARGSTYSVEERAYELLVEKFGESDIIREYKSAEYPFACDFYIKSFRLYIELNLYGVHGGHWFDPMSDKDVERLQFLREKAKSSSWYRKCLTVWTQTDLFKREMAVQNDLNYVVFWKNNLSDFMVWYDAFDFKTPCLKLF